MAKQLIMEEKKVFNSLLIKQDSLNQHLIKDILINRFFIAF